MCKNIVNSCHKTIWTQITCDFGPCAAVEYPYISVEVVHREEIGGRAMKFKLLTHVMARDLSFTREQTAAYICARDTASREPCCRRGVCQQRVQVWMYGCPHWQVSTSLVLVVYSRTTRSRGGGDSNRGHEQSVEDERVSRAPWRVSLGTGAAASGSIGPRAQGGSGRDGGESFKTSGYSTETLPDPELGHARPVDQGAAFNKAYDVDGLGNMAPTDSILQGSVMLRWLCGSLSDSEISIWQSPMSH